MVTSEEADGNGFGTVRYGSEAVTASEEAGESGFGMVNKCVGVASEVIGIGLGIVTKGGWDEVGGNGFGIVKKGLRGCQSRCHP